MSYTHHDRIQKYLVNPISPEEIKSAWHTRPEIMAPVIGGLLSGLTSQNAGNALLAGAANGAFSSLLFPSTVKSTLGFIAATSAIGLVTQQLKSGIQEKLKPASAAENTR